MSVFSYPTARYFCNTYSTRSSAYPDDIRTIMASIRRSTIREGDRYFRGFAETLLAHGLYCYYLGIEKYVRGIELLEKGDMHWGHVSLYYSAFFSSKAIMSVFGIGGEQFQPGAFRVFNCTQTTPGNIEITFRNHGDRSHKAHWNFFYHNSQLIKSYIPPVHSPSCDAHLNNPLWMTYKRNEINYTPVKGIRMKYNFILRNPQDRLIQNLPPDLLTQMNISKGFIHFSHYLYDDLNIKPDSFNHLFNNRIINTILRRDIYNLKKCDFNVEKMKSIFMP